MRLAITGATGFVGGRLLALAIDRGHAVRALARRRQEPRAGVEWVTGALDDRDALAALVTGAEAVVHVAGAVTALDRSGFAHANVVGTQAVIAAAQSEDVQRLVHVSSLAAREPALSLYGWSKAEAETAVRKSGLACAMVRPPAVYGPGDRQLLDMFRAARAGVVPLPPPGRLSVIHVDDLAGLLLALARSDDAGVFEADDGRSDGWSHVEFARAIGEAVGRRILAVPLPKVALAATARIDTLLRGREAKLTRDRVDYFCHPDWTIDPGARPPARLWRPDIETRAGLAATARAYRAAGWLR